MRFFSGAAALPKINPQNERSPGVRQRLQTHSPLLRLLRLALPPVSNIFKLFLNMAAADGRTGLRENLGRETELHLTTGRKSIANQLTAGKPVRA